MDEIKYRTLPLHDLSRDLRKLARGKSCFLNVTATVRRDRWEGSKDRIRDEARVSLQVPLKTLLAFVAELTDQHGKRRCVVKVGESQYCLFISNVYDEDQDPTP